MRRSLYRQTTISALLGLQKGDNELAYQDVKAAWQAYLRDDNHGRPFILLGHSQGSRHLIRLLAEEIEPDAALRSRLVSALLPGFPLSVPQGQDVGGSLKVVPLCRAGDQTGCVVNYSSFAADTLAPASTTVNVAGHVLPSWGLHLIDIDVVQGGPISLARRQTAAWLAKAGH